MKCDLYRICVFWSANEPKYIVSFCLKYVYIHKDLTCILYRHKHLTTIGIRCLPRFKCILLKQKDESRFQSKAAFYGTMLYKRSGASNEIIQILKTISLVFKHFSSDQQHLLGIKWLLKVKEIIKWFLIFNKILSITL